MKFNYFLCFGSLFLVTTLLSMGLMETGIRILAALNSLAMVGLGFGIAPGKVFSPMTIVCVDADRKLTQGEKELEFLLDRGGGRTGRGGTIPDCDLSLARH
jgi:hypothetical protein